jgi:acylphosphatase
MRKQVMLKIYGRVQMVFFRDSARREAEKLKLVGWVRNEPNGTVRIVAEGEEARLKQLINWCYNGPILAKVTKIDAKWQRATGQFKEFEIRY